MHEVEQNRKINYYKALKEDTCFIGMWKRCHEVIIASSKVCIRNEIICLLINFL